MKAQRAGAGPDANSRQHCAGTVTNGGGKPVAGTWVSSYGPHRPQSNAAVIGTQTTRSGITACQSPLVVAASTSWSAAHWPATHPSLMMSMST